MRPEPALDGRRAPESNRAAQRRANEPGGPRGDRRRHPRIVLMQNAGDAVVREITRRWSPRPVSVLCGPGNNGGDGFVVAAALAQRGWPVRVALLGTRGELARRRANSCGRAGRGAVEPLSPAVLDGAALIVDALFGSGLNRPLGADVARRRWRRRRSARLPLIAVDVPSGVMGDSGACAGRGRRPPAPSPSRARSPAMCCCRAAICAARWWSPISASRPAAIESLRHRHLGKRPRAVAGAAAAHECLRPTSTRAAMRCCAAAIP